MCFCFPKQNKIFDFVSASKVFSVFCFRIKHKAFMVPENLSYYNNIRQDITQIKHKMYVYVHCLLSLGLFPQVKIVSLADTKNKKYVYLRKQLLKVFLLAETKSKILFCLGKQKIFSLAWENNYKYIFTYGNKPKEFLLLVKTKPNILF